MIKCIKIRHCTESYIEVTSLLKDKDIKVADKSFPKMKQNFSLGLFTSCWMQDLTEKHQLESLKPMPRHTVPFKHHVGPNLKR